MKTALPACWVVLLGCLLALPTPVWSQTAVTNSATVASPSPAAEKGRSREAGPLLRARAPVAGQPFDDREIELFFESEARKLWNGGKIQALRFESHTCALEFPLPATEKLAVPVLAARAESATLVLGEFSREPKKRDVAFNVAGGAFVVTSSGVCITSLHVAKDKGARGFCAMTRDGQVFPVREVLAYEPVNDLAILQLALPGGMALPVLPLARDPAPIGSPVFVMSHPDDRFFFLSAGYVSRHTLWRTDTGDESFMAITADFAKGSSGCPVLDERGAVIGIVNNTESIYYDDDGRKKQTDLQMVVKNATPSWAVHTLLGTGKVTLEPGKK